MPALRLIRPIAVFAVIATVFGRMVAPAAAGLAVGIDRYIHAVDAMGATVSQLFALASMMTAMALISAVATSRSSYPLRIVAIVGGSFVTLVVLHATARRVPGMSTALLAASASALALVAAWAAVRRPFARAVGAVVGLTGLGALVRLAGVLLALRAAEEGPPALATAARAITTVAFWLDAATVLLAATAWSSLRGGRSAANLGAPHGAPGRVSAPSAPTPDHSAAARPGRLVDPITIAALVVAMIITRQALAGAADDAGAFDALARRALDRVLMRPAPAAPIGLQLFVAAFSTAFALLVVLARTRLPALAGALALVLLAHGATDVPLNALSLVIAALSVALVARDDRAFWAAVLVEENARSAHVIPKPDALGVRQVDAGNDNR